MLFTSSFATLSVVFYLVSFCAGHGLVTTVNGANGLNAPGFGVIADTPRDGSGAVPFQQDTSIIREREISSGKTTACGRTKAGGNVDIAAEMAKVMAAGVPTAAADGTVSMTLHQVNQDGAGPFTVDVDPTGTGTGAFQPMTVTTQVPGKDLPVVGSFSSAKATDFPLAAQLPAGVKCTGGGAAQVCLVRARNSAIAGPFGSCGAVSTAAGGAAGAVTGAAANAAAATASTAATNGTAAAITAAAPATGAVAATPPTVAQGKAGGLKGALGAFGIRKRAVGHEFGKRKHDGGAGW